MKESFCAAHFDFSYYEIIFSIHEKSRGFAASRPVVCASHAGSQPEAGALRSFTTSPNEGGNTANISTYIYRQRADDGTRTRGKKAKRYVMAGDWDKASKELGTAPPTKT